MSGRRPDALLHAAARDAAAGHHLVEDRDRARASRTRRRSPRGTPAPAGTTPHVADDRLDDDRGDLAAARGEERAQRAHVVERAG